MSAWASALRRTEIVLRPSASIGAKGATWARVSFPQVARGTASASYVVSDFQPRSA